jgi:hypothetical protein
VSPSDAPLQSKTLVVASPIPDAAPVRLKTLPVNGSAISSCAFDVVVFVSLVSSSAGKKEKVEIALRLKVLSPTNNHLHLICSHK